MSFLEFNNSEPKLSGEKKTLSIILGIGLLVGTIALGSTLAASINLNNGGPVEFGQGVTQTVACDSNGVTLTPYSTFENDGADSGFYFSSLEISGVSDNCSGVTFKVRAYMNGNNEPLTWPSGSDLAGDSFEFGFIVNGSWTAVESCMLLNNQVTGISNNNAVKIDWTSCVPDFAALAGSVDRITIESSVNPNSGAFAFQVGDVGPGGGIVYYYNETGFACGPSLLSTCNYLEYAPNRNWNGQENTSDPNYQWADSEYQAIEIGSGAQNASIGSGYANTVAITTQGNGISTAAGASRAYRGGNKDDWYLPSRDELNQLCVYVNGLGVGPGGICITDGTLVESYPQSANAAAKGFQVIDFYWNSTEGSPDGGQGQWFYDGSFYNSAEKRYLFKVRPIRAF